MCRQHFRSSPLYLPLPLQSILEDMFWDIYTLVLSVWYSLPSHPWCLFFFFFSHPFFCSFFSQHAFRHPTRSRPVHPTPCFPLLPPPLLSIPPFLLGSGVSNQCLSCLIPSRCCAAVCVCERLCMRVGLIVASLYLIQTQNENEGSQGRKGKG